MLRICRAAFLLSITYSCFYISVSALRPKTGVVETRKHRRWWNRARWTSKLHSLCYDSPSSVPAIFYWKAVSKRLCAYRDWQWVEGFDVWKDSYVCLNLLKHIIWSWCFIVFVSACATWDNRQDGFVSLFECVCWVNEPSQKKDAVLWVLTDVVRCYCISHFCVFLICVFEPSRHAYMKKDDFYTAYQNCVPSCGYQYLCHWDL